MTVFTALQKRMCILVVLLTVFTIFLTGCWDQRIFEQTGFILQLGLESGSGGKIIYTTSSPVVDENAKVDVEVTVSEANLLREGRELTRMESAKALEGGKIQMIYFSEELAGKGIHELLEVFERSPANPLLSNIVIVEGSPRELIEKSVDFKQKPRPAFYINQLLRNNRDSAYIPETRIYRFDIDYFADGIDPIAPKIRLKEDAVRITGTALFSGDRLVGSIDTTWTGLLLAMRHEKKATEFSFLDPSIETQENSEKKGAVIRLREVKRKISTNIRDGLPTIQFHLSFETLLSEYHWDQMDDTEAQEAMEQRIAKTITAECNKLLQYLQEVGSDPIGLGALIRAKHNSYWKSIDWNTVYRQADITAEAKVEIMRYGSIN